MSTPVSQTAQLLGGPACELGEGPVWHAEAQELGWFDILGKALHRAPLDAEGTLGPVRTAHVGGHLGAAVPVSGPDGGCAARRSPRASRTSPRTAPSPRSPSRRPPRAAATG